VQIEQFDLSLDLWSFFGDEPLIHSLEAENCQVSLAENADGVTNWITQACCWWQMARSTI
jgi:hypothetical protein